MGQLTSEPTIELIQSLDPDVLVVACFPHLIPREIREIPKLAALNVHPSLLPAHRGPDPLFWIMRAGGAGCGVTIHELAERFDTGDILAQRAIPYPAGAREAELERQLAAVGAELAAASILALANGVTIRKPQPTAGASYESWPSTDDFSIDIDRPVRHAWNFIRGVAGRDVPIRVESDAGPVLVADALAFGEERDSPPIPEHDQTMLRFNDGWLLARLSRDETS